MNILGVRIDNLSKKEILEKIESFLNEPRFHHICTVNAEFILRAQIDVNFRQILHESNLNIADSISIKYAFLRYGKWLKCRFAGADLVHEILKIANEKKMGVFLAANKDGLSTWEETADVLQKQYQQVRFSGANLEYNSQVELLPEMELGPPPDILFCSFGAPHQELFINYLKNDTIRLAMGVGGAFDFIAGKARRAPSSWRKIGMEWLWRFIQEPRYRAKRIFNAVIVFPIKVLLNFSKQ